MTVIIIILVAIIMNITAPAIAPAQPDVIPCKDGYQIVYDNGDGTYTEYFVCDTEAIKDLQKMMEE